MIDTGSFEALSELNGDLYRSYPVIGITFLAQNEIVRV